MSAERPIALLELRSGQRDVAETRQGWIGLGLLLEGVLPVYADIRNPDSFTPDGQAVRNYLLLERDTFKLVQPMGMPEAVRPSVYRFRDVPSAERPAFASEIPGYNSAALCDETQNRRIGRSMLTRLGLGAYMPPAILTNSARIETDLQHQEGEQFFIKPAHGYSDVEKDTSTEARRAWLVPRNELQVLLGLPHFAGSGEVYLQPDIAAPMAEITNRLAIDPATVSDYGRRNHHTLRIYQMTGEPADVAEVRLMKHADIGEPAPSHYELCDVDILYDAFPEVESLHRTVAGRLGRYGTNYYAVDYFLDTRGRAMINGVHTRPWLPSIRQDTLSMRTVETEVRKLSELALQHSS